MENIRLSDLLPGEGGSVQRLTTTGSMRRRLSDLGLVTGAEVVCVGKSPGGDPSAYLICGAIVAIRARDAATVMLAR